MTATEEFRRLLQHASDRLAEEDVHVRAALTEAVKAEEGTNRYRWNDAVQRLNSYVAASTYAQLVMDMTAKFLTDGAPTEESVP